MTVIRILLVLCTQFSFFSLSAQPEKPVAWTCEARKLGAREAVLLFKAVIKPGWHIYSVYQKDGGPVKTSFVIASSKGFSVKGKVIEPKPASRYSEAFEIPIHYFDTEVTFKQYIKLGGKETIVNGKLEYMACSDSRCLNPEKLAFSIVVK